MLACALGNDIFFIERMGQANPIDRALLSYAAQNGVDVTAVARQYRRIFDQPFDSENRTMVAGFERDDSRLFVAKGDPDTILGLCGDYVSESGATHRASGDFVLATRRSVQTITQQGDIALALAYRQGSEDTPPTRFTFLCLAQLENPPHADADAVVGALKATGLRVVMLTGDKPETALAVGQRTGIDRQAKYCLTGKQIATMAVSDITQQSGYISIFARLLPSQKGILVRALQQGHHTVAMVGDGANDVIALRAADLGISFVEQSSPFARRIAHILIHNLADLLTLVASAGRMRRQIRALVISRTLILAAILLGSYAWLFSRLL
jgi:Ca2+-transporting ATPase